jgi:RNA polymerase sigma-70 factor (ECF subfamily)
VQGDPAAFEAVYRHFEPEVRRWVMRIVRNGEVADEVLVEAFWRAYRGRARFDPARSFGAWMRRIATHASLDHLERARRQAHSSPIEVHGPASAPTDDGTLRDAITVAFRKLSPRLQVAATLALVEGRPHAEIAEALGTPIGTVKSRVFHAVRALRKELGRMGIRP